MGCFDTVYFRCPKCGVSISEQSKGGACSLTDYNLYEAPLGVLAGMSESYYCDGCDSLLILRVQTIATIEIEREHE